VFDVPGGRVLLASAPFTLGDLHWTIVAERPWWDALAPLEKLRVALGGLVAIAATLGWFLGRRLWRQFAGRLNQLAEVVRRVQQGDRGARVSVKQGGPVGDLAAAINRLLDDRLGALARAEQDTERLQGEIEALHKVVAEASGGDLRPRATAAEGPLGNVAKVLNSMLDELGTLVTSLRSASSKMIDSATQIRTSAEQVATGATSQTRDCSSSNASLQSVVTVGERVTQHSRTALEAVRRGEQAGRLGQTAIQDVISGADGLQRETRAATVKIKRLGERSMQVSAIIGTISKMSAQTDMLALNASIEASRAGEHGQGFTVVAEEVRKLAERAAAATKEIERLIEGIQSDVNEAVTGMERHGERLEIQSAAASQASQALKRIVSASSETASLIQQIGSAAEEQVSAAGGLSDTLSRIAETARSVQQSTDQARRTTGDLLSASKDLDARVGRFHT
jgi:twitching motility protein PilJ